MRGIRSGPVLHRDRIVLARLAVRVDQQVVEAPVRADALRVRVAHQRHDRPVERHGHVQRPGVGRQHERRAVEDADELPQPAAQRRVHRLALARDTITASAASSRGERPPTSTGCSPKSLQSASHTSAQRSGSQSFSGLLVATTIGAIGRSNPARNSRCHARSSGHGPRSHDRLAVRDAERVEELEVLVLHVLPFARRDAMRGEQPVDVARARAVEAELHRRAGERRDEPRLEVDLQRRARGRTAASRARVARRGTRASRASGRTRRSRRRTGVRARASPGPAAAPT